MNTIPEVIQAVANSISRLTGENMALRAVVNALIATHPDRVALAATFEIAQRSAFTSWAESSPDDLTRFRAEQVMDQFAKEIDDWDDSR